MTALFTGGRFYTMDPARPTAEAVLIDGDRIISVGNQNELPTSHDREPHDVVDLSGKVVFPGFIDNHLQPFLGGWVLQMEFLTPFPWNLPRAKSKESAATTRT